MKAGDKDKTDVGEYSTEVLSVKNVVDLYLENVIEDRHIFDEQSKTKKIVKGSRAIKGKIEARRTLYVDVVSSIGEKAAVEITRKDVVSLIKGIIDRGAQVQAGKVLSELTAAYEYCIGLDYFPDTFANPGLLAKSSLKQTRIKLTVNKRQRVLSEIELKAVLQWLPKSGFSKHPKSILMLTLWTGCRTGEISNAVWKAFDLEKATWHLKATKMVVSDMCNYHLNA